MSAGYPPPDPVPRPGSAPPAAYAGTYAVGSRALAPQPAALPSPMPDGMRTYPQMLRGPRHRWWKPLLSLLLAFAMFLVAQVLAFLPFLAWGLVATGGQDFARWVTREFGKLADAQIDAPGFFYTNIGLAALIPIAGLSIWAVHGIRPRFVSSVVGGLRWRWLLRCLIVVVPVYLVYAVVGIFTETASPSGRPSDWIALVVLVVLTTPLQAAGEEYFFRGWILQNVGSWFKRPMLSMVSGTVVSVAAFSSAHGSPDPWVLASLAVFATSCCLLAWRTGGLEAGIAVHTVNNFSAFFTVIYFGGWDQAFIGSGTKGTPSEFLVEAAVQIIVFALLWWQAGRAKVRRTYQPG